MEYCLLGPLTVRFGGTALAVPRGTQRAVLAALLLRANRVVSLDELAEAIWGADPPPSARVNVQNHVARLRNTLRLAGPRIATRTNGYLIELGDGELDIARFEALLGEAKAKAGQEHWMEAADRATAALALWQGEPLADVGSDVLTGREVPRLAELLLQAAETRIDADLHLGRHREVIGELRQLAEEEPLRERLHALLMLALYRDSRQAEALGAFQRARRVLVEELGTEPGPELQQLHQQVLAADPALFLAGPTAAAAAVAAAPTGPAPRQLPAGVVGFTGRTAELAALTEMLDQAGAAGPGTAVISAIGGTAGVGKTALALHWAHQIAHRFGDGQLYVNLRGFDPSGIPVSPAEAIRGFLGALGVSAEGIPPQPDAQAGLYRSLLADKRMLILADNARDEQQVRPLLPASPGSLVLVTSRNQLGGLGAVDGARLISLDVLSHEEAMQLLTARLGAARVSESGAVGELARLCACLPLALAVVAARAATRPGFPLAALAAELADSADRLDALDVGDPGSTVRAVFSWSTRQLSGEAARMFRLLGIHPGPDISIPAAASLAGCPQPKARALLRELAHAHLAAEHVPGRYTFHDLLRAYAAEQALHTESDAGRREATGRMLDHYLHTAARAGLLLDPSKEPVALAPLRVGAAAGQPADYDQALAWYEAERQVLCAAVTLAAEAGFDTHAWQLPWAMTSFLRARGHWQEWAATQRTALTSATRLGDTAAQAVSARLLAMACTYLGDDDQAQAHCISSLTLYQLLGNRFGEARIQQNLAWLAEDQGRYGDALKLSEQALRLYQAIDDKAAEAEALNSIGWAHGLLGDYQQARAFCRRALTLNAETAANRWAEADAWFSLGYAEHHLRNPAEAVACYQRALSLYRQAGSRFRVAHTLNYLGNARHAAGELEEARDAWQHALSILRDLQHPEAADVRVKLTSTNDHA